MKRTCLTIIAVALLNALPVVAAETSPVPQVPPNTKAIIPTVGTSSGKPTKGHIRFCEQAKAGGFDVLFLGDSITANWGGPGKEVWDKVIAPLTAANFGFPGNCTEHVLWGLDNGLIEGALNPKVIVLMIGTNNTRLRKDPPEAIAAGVGAIVDRLYKRFPKTPILLFGIFPHGATPDDAVRKNNDAANAILAKFDGYHNVRYLDIGAKLLEKDGTLSKEIMPDLLHPGPKGYEIWAAALEPQLKALLATGAPEAISIRQDASELESFAANEVRRYVYLRTGRLLPVKKGATGGDRIVLTCKDRKFCGELGQDLGPQQFTLKTAAADGGKVWSIVGGDEVGALYGAYRFAEKLGIRFGLDEDVVPDESLAGGWPEIDEIGKPRFALRGLQPFHDFSVGPDWWNLCDYQSVLSQMAKLRMNFLGFHTYPSWNPAAGPEANVWIGLPEDVDEQGNVRFGYESGVVTTRRGWETRPYPTAQYACGAGQFFESDDYGPDFMLDCLDWPKTEQASAAMFNRYGDLQKKAFGHGRRLGVKICVGTELPLGVPKALAARLQAKGMKPDDPAVIGRLYEGTFLRLMRKSPVDYYWFWTPEIWLEAPPGARGWEMTTTANTERDLGLAEAAAKAVKASFGLATCGWLLGTRKDPLWTDQHTPKSWAISSLSTGVGRVPVDKNYGVMTGRPRWVIGWAEDDDTAGAHCCTCWDLQLWVSRMFFNSSVAYRYGCEGMLAIHWRTAAISPNIAAVARAGWDFDGAGGDANPPVGPDPGKMSPVVDAFWADWGRGLFGGDAGAEAGRVMQKFDGGHLAVNAMIQGGAQTTDARISEFFAPLDRMESLRPRIQGAGNLDRFDYWCSQIRLTRLRVRTWVLSARLGMKMGELDKMPEADKKLEFARKEILPLRLDLARSYEDMIDALVHCAKSPGEIGTISSIESGRREQIVSAHDAAIAKVLGEPLPAETAVSTAYRGAPRIFASAKCTQMNAGEPHEIRAFVLSGPKCAGLNLYWRGLGEGAFKKVEAGHRARQAYRVALPAQSQGTVEYYLEAVLDNGQKVLWPATAPSMNQTVVVW
ncbi:MAG: GDSL-type esterase/lipase family protein [Planctomycetota bacterium]|nr:GDSL-type esterase/lipase family protein [Planctomycetota bacterium]